MTQERALRTIRRRHWRALEQLARTAYREGFDDGLVRARGQGRRGRTIRGDATVARLVKSIERHFGLDRYGFEVRVVHKRSGKRVPARDPLRKYRVDA